MSKTKKIEVHQIYYHPSQLAELDSSFIPYDNKGKNYPSNFEYAVFFDLYKKTDWSRVDLTGTVSWKFRQKTGLTGKTFLERIQAAPEADVYFVNPFPELCVYENVWKHGQSYHPHLIELTQELLRKCGYSEDLIRIDTPPNKIAYCNYWVANEEFWNAYIRFLKPIWDYVTEHDDELTEKLKLRADLFINAPYLPFIFERLFSTFLSMHPFKVVSIPMNSDKLRESALTIPIRETVLRVSQLPSHESISFVDKTAIRWVNTMRKWRHYYAPLVKRRLLRKKLNP